MARIGSCGIATGLLVYSPAVVLSPACHRQLAAIVVVTLAFAWLGLASSPVAAQIDERYAEEPTDGIELPGVGLAGEHDAFSVSANPAGLRYLRAWHVGMALGIADADTATSAGSGVGLYLGHRIGGGILPAMGLGLGLEFGQPSRVALTPDPGTPIRLSLGYALPLGKDGGIGVTRHLFFDEAGSSANGLGAWDVGLAYRLGARLAVGAVVRDLNAPTLDPMTGASVEREYELELTTRPLATDRLQFSLGGRVAEKSEAIDGWARLDARITRGLYLHGEVETRELTLVTTSPIDTVESSEREYLARVGFTVSFGLFAASVYGAGARGTTGRGAAGDNRLAGGTLLLRASGERIPSVLGPTRRIERLLISGPAGQRELTSYVLYLRRVARDPGVVALLLTIDDVGAGWATAQELWDEISRVRSAGKKVYAYLVAASTRDYFVATAADRIYLDPAGGIRMQGLSATTVFFKGVFDQLGVTAQFIKVDEYKAAPESYTRYSPTEPAWRMREELYDDIFENLVARVAERRAMDAREVERIIDNGPYTAGDLEGSPLVDAVARPEEISKLVVADLGRVYPVAAARRQRPDRWDRPAVAIVYIDGDIVSGKSQTVPFLGREISGAETIVQAITKARTDEDIAAIVVRIDTPGGSALAAELMAREVFATREVKPIICSMGDMATSGGYFAAAGCDVIMAQPTTITGSIGIFTGKFDVSGLLARVGLSWSVHKRGARSDMESFFRPYTDEEVALVLDKIRYLYGRFIDTVAEGRGMTRDEVDDIARGRVWSGRAAHGVGLVDRFGGLADAIDLAKERAGLSPGTRVRIVQMPEKRASVLDWVLGNARAGAGSGAASPIVLPGQGQLLESIPASVWHEPDQPQARLPFSLVW